MLDDQNLGSALVAWADGALTYTGTIVEILAARAHHCSRPNFIMIGIVGTLVSLVSLVWVPATLLCCTSWVQRQMLYLHNFTFFPGKWLTEPERAGFLSMLKIIMPRDWMLPIP
jgi:hypothetical protein